jgi:hypothetical protein
MANIQKIRVADYLNEGHQGIAAVERYEISKEASAFTSMRAMQHPDEYIAPGVYTRLMVKGQLMMSDTQMEKDTNLRFVHGASGEVLIAGLGLGLVIQAIMDKPGVTHVTVVEKYQDVIDLVGPTMKALYGDKLTIILADIFEWKPERGKKYDTIYFDIWASQSTDTLKEIARLHQRFGGRLASNGWLDSWRRAELQARKRREARQGRGLGFGWCR